MPGGPAPRKAPSARRRPNAATAFKRLPHEGRSGPPPPWPLPLAQDPDQAAIEDAQWKKLWSLPQAFEWERMRCEDLVALYCRVFARAMDPRADQKLLSELRQLDSKIGLSPRAMQELRWETDEAPVEDEDAPAANGTHAPYVPQSPKAESP